MSNRLEQPWQRERRNEEARARRRAIKRDEEIRAPFNGPDPVSKAAHEAGGVAIHVNLRLPTGESGGCGTFTHVTGTNGGKMPCGSTLTMFGKTEPYYCAHCQPG